MSEPRLAASVILARAGTDGPELYMTRRSAASAFAPDAFVFPGGTIDAQDHSDAARERALGVEGGFLNGETRLTIAAELPIAALRELFEEAGVLIARTAAGASVDAARVDARDVADARVRVRAGELGFAEFLREREWFADARALTFFSHWITPESEPRRYSAHFFFALAPPDQAGQADRVETHDGIWIAPRRALERYREGRFHLVYPTIKHLQRLENFADLQSMAQYARSKTIASVLPDETPDGFTLPPELERTW